VNDSSLPQISDRAPKLDENTASADTTVLARHLAERLIDQARSPWRTLWSHLELSLMKGIYAASVLPKRRQLKLRRQIEKRTPERFLSVVRHADQFRKHSVPFEHGSNVDFRPYDSSLDVPDCDVRLIAFYLPQFHPFPENDQWWGKGFTEWTNVGKAKPIFDGHYQPHCPIHLGYYDLRVPEVMVEQARIAKQYGVSGFAYHFYWFSGKTLMELPLRTMLGNESVSIPFFLSWANENWTRRWDGRNDDVLIKQTHSVEDSRAMIRHVCEYMRDPRYIRVKGRPVFSVYRPRQIPNLAATVQTWRDEARQQGIGEIYLIGIQRDLTEDHRKDGFDANLEFTPHGIQQTDLSAIYPLENRNFNGRLHDYDSAVSEALKQEDEGLQRFRCATLGWDNSARSPDRAMIYVGFSIDTYKRWLTELCARARTESWRHPDERFVFINAWNEWAEGTHLEPDQRYGFAYLEATRQAVLGK
jgi:lipopolysaccharide biosynthesis protein